MFDRFPRLHDATDPLARLASKRPGQVLPAASLVEGMGLRRERLVDVRDLLSARTWKTALLTLLAVLLLVACLV